MVWHELRVQGLNYLPLGQTNKDSWGLRQGVTPLVRATCTNSLLPRKPGCSYRLKAEEGRPNETFRYISANNEGCLTPESTGWQCEVSIKAILFNSCSLEVCWAGPSRYLYVYQSLKPSPTPTLQIVPVWVTATVDRYKQVFIEPESQFSLNFTFVPDWLVKLFSVVPAGSTDSLPPSLEIDLIQTTDTKHTKASTHPNLKERNLISFLTDSPSV